MEDTDGEPRTVCQAARVGDLESMKQLIEEGHPTDAPDNRGWRPLHEAANGGFVDCLQHLLDLPECAVNSGSHDGQTALHLACTQNELICAEILLRHGADPNCQDFMECTPLHKAMLTKNEKLITVLLNAKADINCEQYTGTTPLHQAASEGWTDLARLLLDRGAKLNVTEENNITPIFSAAQFNRLKTLELLLQHASDTGEQFLVNKRTSDGATPLFLAAQEGHLKCISLLVDYGASVNICTHDPKASPLLAALQFDHADVVRYLIPLTSARCVSKCKIGPFYFSTLQEETTCTKILIEAGFDVNERRSQPENVSYEPRILAYFIHQVMYSLRMTPLAMLTIFENPIEHARLLIKAGAYLDPRTPHEVPPLLPALDKDQFDSALLFIDSGASVNLYHPKVVGNVSILSSIHYWEGLNLLLYCGAEVESIFKDELTLAPMNYFSEEEAELMDDMGIYSYREISESPIRLWMLMIEARRVMLRRKVRAVELLTQLMHFTGNVHLRPELKSVLDTLDEWTTLSTIQASPRSLLHLCRICIRRQFKPRQLLRRDLMVLPLPRLLLDYLCFKEILGDVQYSI